MSEFITVSGEEEVEITLRPDNRSGVGDSVAPLVAAAITEESLQHATSISVKVEAFEETRSRILGGMLAIRARIAALGTSASVVYSYSNEIREKLQEGHVLGLFPEGSLFLVVARRGIEPLFPG